MSHQADKARYERMQYRNAGASGLKLPVISLGLWQNFGAEADDVATRDIITTAFDHGVTHFDLADNYGPPQGSAEERFGRILHEELAGYRDEMVISSKAGYTMWPGPYGDWGSRKHLIASCDQSLRLMGLEYVDIFYHHRPDPATPLEETMGALASLVKAGKALYIGLSRYYASEAIKAQRILVGLGCPCILDQVRYSILDRTVETDHLLSALDGKIGMICFSPLAQGLLSSRYLSGSIPAGSRAKENRFLKEETITPAMVAKLNRLDMIASRRGQSLSEMALSWVLRNPGVSSVLIGVHSSEQLLENLSTVGQGWNFSEEELTEIDAIVFAQ